MKRGDFVIYVEGGKSHKALVTVLRTETQIDLTYPTPDDETGLSMEQRTWVDQRQDTTFGEPHYTVEAPSENLLLEHLKVLNISDGDLIFYDDRTGLDHTFLEEIDWPEGARKVVFIPCHSVDAIKHIILSSEELERRIKAVEDAIDPNVDPVV